MTTLTFDRSRPKKELWVELTVRGRVYQTASESWAYEYSYADGPVRGDSGYLTQRAARDALVRMLERAVRITFQPERYTG